MVGGVRGLVGGGWGVVGGGWGWKGGRGLATLAVDDRRVRELHGEPGAGPCGPGPLVRTQPRLLAPTSSRAVGAAHKARPPQLRGRPTPTPGCPARQQEAGSARSDPAVRRPRRHSGLARAGPPRNPTAPRRQAWRAAAALPGLAPEPTATSAGMTSCCRCPRQGSRPAERAVRGARLFGWSGFAPRLAASTGVKSMTGPFYRPLRADGRPGGQIRAALGAPRTVRPSARPAPLPSIVHMTPLSRPQGGGPAWSCPGPIGAWPFTCRASRRGTSLLNYPCLDRKRDRRQDTRAGRGSGVVHHRCGVTSRFSPTRAALDSYHRPKV